MIQNHRLSEIRNDMTPNAKRRKYISELVTKRGYARVVDLAENLGVTTATIRTDLQYLEDKGALIRSHGGAITATSAVRDLKEDVKKKVNAGPKKRIGKEAAKLINENESIIIASGSTMVAFAEEVVPCESLNIVTPSIRIASQFLDRPNVTILQLGGIIYGNTLSTRGAYAEAGLDTLHCSKVFFGVEGFDIKSGLTCATLEEANLTRKMMKSATQSIVLADSTKFCRRGFGKICNLEDIDILITDNGLPEEARSAIESIGIAVIIAN